MNQTRINTIFGVASINQDGYYRITSTKENNQSKLLHRLIYEKFWNVKLPREIHIHHKNGNKLDNCILNLEAIHESEHPSIHRKGIPFTTEGSINRSKSTNTSGVFRVCKKKDNTCKQGFVWSYQYYDGDKRRMITSVDMDTLKQKVLDKGLEWVEYDGNR